MLKKKIFDVDFYVNQEYKQGIFAADNKTEIKSLIHVKYGGNLKNIYIRDTKEIDMFQAMLLMDKNQFEEESR
ncbi:hypothetical protein ACI3ER_11725 [Bacillus sp. Wb]